MKKNGLLIIGYASMFYSCDPIPFSKMSQLQKEKVIIDNSNQFISSNTGNKAVFNLAFLLEHSNKQRPCPQTLKPRVYFKDQITAEISMYFTTYDDMFINTGQGLLDRYAISFGIDNNTGVITSVKSIIYTKSNGKSDFHEYDTATVPNVRKIFTTEAKIAEVNKFYNQIMKEKQRVNKGKCDLYH